MFSTARYFIKTSIVFLIVGLLTGLHMTLATNVFKKGYGAELISAHTHVILVGSVIMMIMGVALWFFPRPEKTDTQYNPANILIAYWIMTIATSLRYIFQVTAAYTNIDWVWVMITVFSTFQIIAIIYFFYAMRGRIRASSGSVIREQKGEKF